MASIYHTRISCVSCIVLGFTFFGQAPAQTVSSSPLACYELHTGAWSHAFPSGSPDLHQPPDRVYLFPDTLSYRNQVSWHLAGPQNPAITSRRMSREPTWRRVSADSIIVV